MKTTIYIFIVVLFTLISCKGKKHSQNKAFEDTLSIVENETIKEPITDDKPVIETYNESVNTWPMKLVEYSYQNDTLLQEITVYFDSPEEIKFAIKTRNQHSGNSGEIYGVAQHNDTGDPEVDEDEEGIAYPATEYIYDSDCWLQLRIDMETGNYCRIIEADGCDYFHKPDCPFQSVKTMRRKEKISSDLYSSKSFKGYMVNVRFDIDFFTMEFQTTDGEKMSFSYFDMTIDPQNNPWFDYIVQEGSMFPEYRIKESVKDILYRVEYEKQIREMHLAGEAGPVTVLKNITNIDQNKNF